MESFGNETSEPPCIGYNFINESVFLNNGYVFYSLENKKFIDAGLLSFCKERIKFELKSIDSFSLDL